MLLSMVCPNVCAAQFNNEVHPPGRGRFPYVGPFAWLSNYLSTILVNFSTNHLNSWSSY